MKFLVTGSCLLLLLLFAGSLHSQTYLLNGSATQDNCNCYTLTKAINIQSGSVWNANLINLNQPFDFSFNVYLGCKDADGADGIVFILQTIASSVGTTGAGMGFQGVVPSIGIALDTWQNTDINDPAFDHISIQSNGSIVHGTDLAGPIPISDASANVEDCQWHILRITWDPVTKFLRTYFDAVFRLEANVDLIGSIFNTNPNVYWGFSAATGGSNNEQKFCTALNPSFNTNLTSNSTCINSNTVVFTNTSVSFAPIATFYWDFADGTTSTLANPPPHTYTNPGNYEIKLAITGFDGCKSDTLRKKITVGDLPVASFAVFDTCAGKVPRVIDQSTVTINNIAKWNWLLDGSPVSTAQQPQLDNLITGSHTLQLNVTSDAGCASASIQKDFFVKRVPVIRGEAAGACVKVPVIFTGDQMDNASWISSWSWNFDNGHTAPFQNTTYTYTQPGDYTATLIATADNGCSTDPVTVPVTIREAIASAGPDTVIIRNQPFQLHATGADGGAYNWSPATGMDDPASPDPIIVLDDDAKYLLTVTTPEGCTDDDEIGITVFKGSAIYVPTGFTPNDDGLNDGLLPRYIGIKKLSSFMVYNRWGQVVFSTSDPGKAWNGVINGVKQATGVYIWRVHAVDYVGKLYDMGGTSTLIR